MPLHAGIVVVQWAIDAPQSLTHVIDTMSGTPIYRF